MVENPFYGLAPQWFLYPLVVIATLAAVIASQALISGAFSLAQQAIQLGFSPRMTIVHTSNEASGQIYVPEVNTILMIACVSLTLMFQKSGNLAAAYGIAVMGTMVITTILLFSVERRIWHWPLWQALLLCGLFMVVDIPLLAANVVKIVSGGWVPLVVAFGIYILMTTWKRGRTAVRKHLAEGSLPLDYFLSRLEDYAPHRVKGTAVFMTSTMGVTPPILLHHFKHNKVLHEKVVLFTIVTLSLIHI